MPALQAARDFARNLDFAEGDFPVVPAVDAPQGDQVEGPVVPPVQPVVPAAVEPEEARNLDDGYFSSSTFSDEELVQDEGIEQAEVVHQGVNPG